MFKRRCYTQNVRQDTDTLVPQSIALATCVEMHGGIWKFLETDSWAPHPGILIQWVRGRAGESAFLPPRPRSVGVLLGHVGGALPWWGGHAYLKAAVPRTVWQVSHWAVPEVDENEID